MTLLGLNNINESALVTVAHRLQRGGVRYILLRG